MWLSGVLLLLLIMDQLVGHSGCWLDNEMGYCENTESERGIIIRLKLIFLVKLKERIFAQ